MLLSCLHAFCADMPFDVAEHLHIQQVTEGLQRCPWACNYILLPCAVLWHLHRLGLCCAVVFAQAQALPCWYTTVEDPSRSVSACFGTKFLVHCSWESFLVSFGTSLVLWDSTTCSASAAPGCL